MSHLFIKDVSTEKDAIKPYSNWAVLEAHHQTYAKSIYKYVPLIYRIDDNLIYMETILGSTVHEYITRGNFRNYKSILSNIIRILTFFHHHNFIHGDTNLKNYMIDKHNNIWIIDFGMSRYTPNQSTHRKEIIKLIKSFHQLVGMTVRGLYQYIPTSSDAKWFNTQYTQKKI